MALRSQEEVSLATVFARTLRSVIALTAAEDRRVYPDAGEIVRASREDETAPAALVQLLQFSILPEILGESAGPAIYLASMTRLEAGVEPLTSGAYISSTLVGGRTNSPAQTARAT